MIRWYYANDDQRQGPVSDTEFARLVRDGVIRDTTLVWRHGMKDWERYSEVAPSLPPPEIPAAVPAPAEELKSAQPETDFHARATEVLAAQPPVLHYAGFWQRALAKIVDWLVLAGLGRLLMGALGIGDVDISPLFEGDTQRVMQLMHTLLWVTAIGTTLRLTYHWYFLRRYAATPGKLVLGLRVVRSDGSELSHGRIVGRFFAEGLTSYLTFGVGYLVAAFDTERRAMHDHLCDTRVVTARARD